MVYTTSGFGYRVEVDPEMTLGTLMENIQNKSVAVYRDYFKEVTPSEKSEISFIVNTLGMSSLAKITKQKSSLKRAGTKVDHIHPLRFLQTIFQDEKMKASMQSLYGRSWVWSEFSDGLERSLNEEQENENLPPEYVHDFVHILNIPFDAVYPLIQQSRWDNLVKTLIKLIPRNENADRYNM
ncbi:MAG: hypothetical protein ACK5MA_11365 [Parachlamydiaceae bacterium]